MHQLTPEHSFSPIPYFVPINPIFSHDIRLFLVLDFNGSFLFFRISKALLPRTNKDLSSIVARTVFLTSFDLIWLDLLRCSSELVPELILYEAPSKLFLL
ncbi:hypothetical protein F511_34891 [Dorcoceras hygrometricum]|uniref:Uncharacterized protein n=1 Tax=Dorcoceras hygrometricum TaxID=472368 RepID=A0A2Z7ADI7_9LAMI|nr:hypothetical protein F511_34891 [Dorcoceras hygrometricum]